MISKQFKRYSILALTMAVISWFCLPLSAYTLQTLTTNVQPLNGTANGGETFPGAVVPFGMVQWSPDTSQNPGNYRYSDTQIHGFGLTHASGAGCNYGGDCGFTPFLGSVTNSPYTNTDNIGLNASFYATYSHANEMATPGYYSVQFNNGIRTELTVTARTGFGRFTYPSGNTASMLINAGGDANGTINASIQINPAGNEISGWTQIPGMCGPASAVLYFDVIFDHAFAAWGVWNGATLTSNGTNATGAQSGAYLSFNLPSGGVVLARTAISYVSVTNAQTNLQAESPASSFTSAGFDAMTSAASNNWNGYLNKIQVSGGTVADKETFYTMLYHCLQAPEVVSDVNGQYRGYDGSVHTLSGRTQYGWFSGWDIYRSECQLIAMLDPARASDMAQSLVQDAADGGAMPRWGDAVADTGIMMGDPATPIIAGMYAFGATNFNTASALAAMVKAAVDPTTEFSNGIHERDAERDYLNLGYVPAAESGGYGPVSMTLEYCSADCALARFAQALGNVTNYTLAMNRAQNWRNHFNIGSGYLQQRNADGLWSSGFPTYGGNAYVEGTIYQYTWMVPFNLVSLIDMMGGAQTASARLDTFFTELNDGDTTYSPFAYMGNEPCSETPWIYSFVGKPYRTSKVVRQIITQLYSTAPGGLPGNDDLGQMSSWYVFAALGMYPEIPGDDVLILNGPLFPQAVLHLTNGDVTITGSGAGDSAPYVQSLTVNGNTSNAPWIRFADIAKGVTLTFTMGTTANTNWGSDPLLAPPSYTDGMAIPLAQNYLWGTGLEAGDLQTSWTNSVDSAPHPAGGSNNVGPIQSGPTGPELGVRSESSQSGSAEIMYSGKALGGATDFAYMKVFDLSGSNLTITTGMHLSYWIFPQSPNNNYLVAGSNSAYVALDLIFTDGTNLRDSGLTDQHDVSIHPAAQGGILALDTWNYVTVDLSSLAGKTVNRADLGYDQPGGTGGYRGYVDDVAFTTPDNWLGTNLALNQSASADSQQAGHPAGNGNDGNTGTSWSANDGNTNHWWQVDLGNPCNLTGDEVIWQMNGAVYDYMVTVSLDDTNWTQVVNKTANNGIVQDQTDIFIATGRYVRITVTGVPPGGLASFNEFRVFGTIITRPSAPAGLQATAGYGLIDLNWAAPAGTTSYSIARSTSSGAEVVITNVTTTNYVDRGLVSGTTYYYTVSAGNLLGQSGNSGEVSATPLPRLPGSYGAAVMADNPLAYWPLNETNGSVAYDIVGGNNGIYVGGVTLGQPGLTNTGFGSPSHAVLFDGTTGYVDIPEGPFNLTNAFTTVAWIKVPATPHYSGIIGRGNSSWRMSVDTSGQPSGADGANADATSSSSIVGTSWHMVAYTYTGVINASGNGLLYVDGVLKTTNSIGILTGNGLDVWIGGAPDYGTARLLPGNIAQVAFFTNVFSTAQVLTLYEVGTNTPPILTPVPGSYGATVLAANPLAYWPLNETNGTVAYDIAGGCNGIYIGGVVPGQPGLPLAGFAPQNYSALFDGTSGYVDIPNGLFNITNAITTIAWVKVPATPTHFSGIIGHGDSSWRMSVNAAGKPGGADGANADATSPSSVTGTNWHMVVYTYTGVFNVTGNGLLYVDGVLKATNTVGMPTTNGLDVWIGGSPDYGTTRLLTGGIAQLAVFTNAFSAAQVQALYGAGMNPLPVTLDFVPTSVGNSMNIVWSQGTLLQSTNIIGPWSTNTASSPYTVVPTNAQMYFRVLVK
jgi:predicted alpha-1,2-mannosidase